MSNKQAEPRKLNGIFDDMSIEDYHFGDKEKDFLSATSVKKANNSLKAFKHYTDNNEQSERKIHFDFGNAFELALISPEEYRNKVVIFDASMRPQPEMTFGSKANKLWKQEFEAEATENDWYIVNNEGDNSAETIEKMRVNCESDPVISKLLSKVDYQRSFFWTCPDTGLQLKSRPDVSIIGKDTIVDIKTIETASPYKVSRAIADFDYPTQAVMQIDAVQQTGFIKEVKNYFWLFVEKKAPYDAVLYHFNPEDIEVKMAKYRETLQRIAKAKASGIYPGYSEFAEDGQYGILTAKVW